MVGPCTTAMTSQAMHVMSVDRGNEVQLKNTVVQRIFPHDILARLFTHSCSIRVHLPPVESFYVAR